ncbi:MAG: FeoB-associated Cys-rich membrane protein [Clostridium sp.]|nr:FeoB-associated Cys-rich membrane protein [Clostridium sp.]
MSLNDILQAAGVGLILILAIAWMIRRARRKDEGCGCGCEGCPVKKECNKPTIKYKRP